MSDFEHLDDEQLAAAAEAEDWEALDDSLSLHLVECESCRSEWLMLRRGMGELGEARRLSEPPRRLEAGAIGAAVERQQGGAGRLALLFSRPAWIGAALVALGLFLAVPWDREMPIDETVRTSGTEAFLLPLKPQGNTSEWPLTFRWMPDPRATAYQVVILDFATEEVVLRIPNARSPLNLDEEQLGQLQPGRKYTWSVRALHGVGREAVGRPAHFVWGQTRPSSVD